MATFGNPIVASPNLLPSTAEVFNASKSGGYGAGEYVYREGKLYKFTEAHTGAWTGADVEEVKLADELAALEENVSENYARTDGYYDEMTVGNAEQLVATVGIEDKVPYNFRTAGGSVDIGEREVDEIVGGTIAWNQGFTTDDYMQKTKSGTIVTIPDAAAENAVAMTVDVIPAQNLHGQSGAYPPGASKNLYNPDALTVQSVNTYQSDGTAGNQRSGVIISLDPGVYTAKLDSAQNYIYTNVVDSDYNFVSYASLSTTSVQPAKTFTISEGDSLVIFSASSGSTYSLTSIRIMLESGTESSPYAPYSNICPISGWAGANIWRYGKNLYNRQWINLTGNYLELEGYHNPAVSDENKQSRGIYLIGGKTYRIYCDTGLSSNISYGLYGMRTGSTSQLTLVGSASRITINTTYVAPTSGYYCFWLYSTSMSSVVLNNFIFQVQVGNGEYTGYEAYNGTQYSISWESDAGTIYNGKLNVLTGELTVDMAMMHLDENTSWSIGGSQTSAGFNRFYCSTSPSMKSGSAQSGYCDKLPIGTISSTTQAVVLGYTNSTINVLSTAADVAAFKTEIAALGGIDVVYPLATPQTYQLTATQVALILGTNNIYSDTGDLKITYKSTVNEVVTISGHKYLTRISGTDAMVQGDGTSIIGQQGVDNIFDLTLMFGTAVANYVYGLEQGNVGDGVKWFRNYFPKSYYDYDKGTLMSVKTSAHKTVGFNAYNNSTGTAKLVGGYEYQITGAYTALAYEDISGDSETIEPEAGGYFTPTNSGTLTVTGGNATTTCVHLVWDGERDGEWEEYDEHEYPLDDSLTLNGMAMLDANNSLYFDGDTYESDGTVTRRYSAAVDLGSYTWERRSSGYTTPCFTTSSKTSSLRVSGGVTVVCDKYVGRANDYSSGIKTLSVDKCILVDRSNTKFIIFDSDFTDATELKAALQGRYATYLLAVASQTTESADPYQNPQVVDDFGTEEYVDTRDIPIPVGHDTIYQANLRAKLEMSPDSPDGDGDYIVRQINGENVYVPLALAAGDISYSDPNEYSEGTVGHEIDGIKSQLNKINKGVLVTLTADNWASARQTATVTGLLADETKQIVTVIPTAESRVSFERAGVIAISQAANALTFSFVYSVPTENLSVYVIVNDVEVST